MKKAVSGSRFLTGAPPRNQGVQLYVEEEGKIVFPVTLDDRHEGPPGCAHGGFSASLIDEAMGGAVWSAGYRVVAVNLNIDFRAPVPLGEEVTVRGWVTHREGRKVFTKGEITLPDGRVAVEGQGTFVEAPHLFTGDDSYARAFRSPDEAQE